MAIDLYLIPVSGPCRAVLMTAKCLGVEFNEKIVDFMAGEHLKPEFIQMNPQHCVPTINDGGFILWESRAIQAYLVDKYSPNSPLYPKDPEARAVVDRMLYFDIGTLYKSLYEYLSPQMYRAAPADPEKEELFKKALDLLEGFLGKSPYVAGNQLTIADLSIVASLSFSEVMGYNLNPYPKVRAWLQKLKSEVPSYKEMNDEPLKNFKDFLKSRNFILRP